MHRTITSSSFAGRKPTPRISRWPNLSILLALLFIASLPTLNAAVVTIDIQVVDQETWTADIAPGWLERYRQDKTTLTWKLIAPELASGIPIPNLKGTFDARAWSAFTASPLNPTKNAFRLLGIPNGLEALPNGILRVTWEGERLVNAKSLGLPSDTAAIVLEADEAKKQFTWSYRPPKLPL